jgi:Protein of unknown function (DUF3256).
MKKIILLCFLMASVISLHAQDAKSLFINMPDSLSPLLTKVTGKTLLISWKAI